MDIVEFRPLSSVALLSCFGFSASTQTWQCVGWDMTTDLRVDILACVQVVYDYDTQL